MNIILLGAPGSGKGTQARRLVSSHGLSHLSPGDLFRDAIKAGTELGREIKAYLESGKLVPDDLVSKVIFDNLKESHSTAGFLLDGYPRTEGQAKALDMFGSQNKIAIDAVIFFEVDHTSLVKRLSARRQCSNCKEVYNLETRPPKTADRCDLCSHELIQRKDDVPDVIKERLNVFTQLTTPVLEFYKSRPGFHQINASQEIDRVYTEILAVLQTHSSKEPS